MAIREVLVSFTFEQQRQMINLIGADIGDASLLLTPTPVVVTAINEVITGDVDLSNQTIGMDPGSLAAPSLYWDAGQGFYQVDATKLGLTTSLAITGDLEVDGDITFRAGSGSGGTLTFGDLDTDNIVFNADVQSSIVPDSTANYNLGTATKQWNNIWIDGLASIDNLLVDENAIVTGNFRVDSGNVLVPNTQTTVDLFDDYATTIQAFGAGTSIRIGDVSGTLILRNPTIVGTQPSLTLYNTVATQVSAFGAAENITMGLSTFGTSGVNSNFNIRSDDTVLDGDLNVNGGEILSQANTFDLLVNNSDVRIGAANGIGNTTINNSIKVVGNVDLTNSGTNIAIKDNLTNSLTIKEGTNAYLQIQTTDAAERIILYKDLYVVGNLDISGTTTVIDTTNLEIKDKNITLADTASPTDALADGGGITLKATTDKTITYNNADGVWQTNIGLKVTGRVFAGGSLTSNSGDLNFTLGGSRAFIDWDGSKARIGSLLGGGSGGPVGIYVNGGQTAVFDTSGNFGIGPTSPRSIAGFNSLSIDDTSGSFTDYLVNGTRIGTIGADSNGLTAEAVGTTDPFRVVTNGTERLRISPVGAINFKGALIERCHVVNTTISTSPNVYLNLGNAYLYTTQETTTSTPNITYDGSTTLDSVMGNGEVVSLVLMTTAAAAGYFAAINIDGNFNGANGYTINTDWLGGAAPTAGGSGGIDVYSMTIIKQSASNFNVLISVNNYA